MKVLILASALVATAAQAEFFTGNDLFQKMNSSSLIDQSMALGYVAGASDVGTRITHCPPNNSTIGQVHDMVKNHLETNPGSRHFSADSLITTLLKSVWPCQRRGSSL